MLLKKIKCGIFFAFLFNFSYKLPSHSFVTVLVTLHSQFTIHCVIMFKFLAGLDGLRPVTSSTIYYSDLTCRLNYLVKLKINFWSWNCLQISNCENLCIRFERKHNKEMNRENVPFRGIPD